MDSSKVRPFVISCDKCLFMTLLYKLYINPLTSFRFILRIALVYMWSNFWNTKCNFAKFSGLLPNDQIIMVAKISWQSLENRLTEYKKAYFHFGPSSTVAEVGQTIVIYSFRQVANQIKMSLRMCEIGNLIIYGKSSSVKSFNFDNVYFSWIKKSSFEIGNRVNNSNRNEWKIKTNNAARQGLTLSVRGPTSDVYGRQISRSKGSPHWKNDIFLMAVHP